MENNITPFGRQILVKPVEKKQILVADRNSLCEYGEVIAVGEDVRSIQAGDTIGYVVWGVNSLDIDDVRHYFITESDEFILGKIKV